MLFQSFLRPLLVLALVVTAAGCDGRSSGLPAGSSAPAPPASASAATATGSRVAAGIHYLERYTGGATAAQRLPMIVAIHGLGDRPERFAGLLAGLPIPARLIVPQGLAPYQSGYSWFPIRVRSQDPERISQGMRRAATRLAQLLAELGQRHPTKGKPLVTGFSQGGMLSFALAVDHPQSIAAAIPLAGWLPPPMWPSALPPMAPPIVALHGDGDQLLEIEPTRAAVGKLRQLGFQVELHEYPGVGHTVSPAMRRELYRQLAAQVAGQVAGQSPP